MNRRQSIAHGADFVEPDLVPTRGGVLAARYENNIAGTTDSGRCARNPQDRWPRSPLLRHRIDGFFTDDPALGRQAVDDR